MENKLKETINYRSIVLSGNYKQYGNNVQEIYDKLRICLQPECEGSLKHRYLTKEEEEEFIQNLIEFLQVPQMDFIQKMFTLNVISAQPRQANDVIYCNNTKY